MYPHKNKMWPLTSYAVTTYGYDGLSDLGVEVVVRRPGDGMTWNVKRSAGILLPGWSSA